MEPMDDHPPYPSGLRLAGRRVVVVGGGHVAQRRVPGLLAAGADVVVVSPAGDAGDRGTVLGRRGRPGSSAASPTTDLDDAWYVIAATDDPAVNEQVEQGGRGRADLLRARRRRDRARPPGRPAVGRHDGRDRRRARHAGSRGARPRVRDEILDRAARGHDRRQRHARPSVPGVVLVGGGPGRPRADLGGRAQGADGGRRRGRRPARAARAARRAARRRRARRRGQAAARARPPARRRSTGSSSSGPWPGKRVVRFKGGDSFVFGRGFEEVDGLPARPASPVHRDPGAVAARSRVPARRRHPGHPPRRRPRLHGRSPATCRPGHPDSLVDWDAVGRLRGTLVLMMAVENAPAIAEALLAGGRDAGTPVAVVCDGTDAGRAHRALHARRRSAADLDRRRAYARRRSSWSARSSPSRIRNTSRGRTSGRALIEVDDPDDPRLADYRDLRDVQLRKHLEAEHGLFLAEGEKVVRRAVEAGFTPAVVPDGAALARRARRRARAPATRPATSSREALAEQVTGFHVHRGALASLRAPSAARPSTRCSTARVGARARGRRRPHQRRRDLPLRRGARLRRRAARAALRRPALPPLDQGRRWARCSRLPWTRLPDWYDALPDLSRAGFTTVALTLADDAVPHRGGRRRTRPGRPRARLGGPRAVAALGGGGRPPRGHPDARRASTRSTSPRPPPSPATSSPPDADRRRGQSTVAGTAGQSSG